MSLTLSGSGTIGGLVAGGLPDATVTAADLASGAARTNFGAGAVLQVVQGTLLTVVSTNSASFQSSGLIASITPTAPTSKILVTAGFMGGQTGTGDANYFTIYRSGSNIVPVTAAPKGFVRTYTGSTVGGVYQTITYLDAPSTISTQQYEIFFCTDGAGGTVYMNRIAANANSIQPAIITLMEIAG